jgi:hypothetical protein
MSAYSSPESGDTTSYSRNVVIYIFISCVIGITAIALAFWMLHRRTKNSQNSKPQEIPMRLVPGIEYVGNSCDTISKRNGGETSDMRGHGDMDNATDSVVG